MSIVKEKSTHAWYALFSILMVVGAFCVEIWAVRAFLKAKELENWPSAKGKILRSELITKSLLHESYEASIEYTYGVGNLPYRSLQIRPRGASTRYRDDVKPLVKKYQVGMVVPVRYNPTDPSEAYLEVGVDLIYYFLLVLPLVFAIIFGAAFYEFIFGSLATRSPRTQALQRERGEVDPGG